MNVWVRLPVARLWPEPLTVTLRWLPLPFGCPLSYLFVWRVRKAVGSVASTSYVSNLAEGRPAFGKRNFAACRIRAAFGGRRPKTRQMAGADRPKPRYTPAKR